MAGRRDAYWKVRFAAGDSYAERTRPGHGADGDAEAAGDPCSRDLHCAGRRIVTENGERKVIPARTYGPFCHSCRGLIASCLSELPLPMTGDVEKAANVLQEALGAFRRGD
jgi:hypothetical protein